MITKPDTPKFIQPPNHLNEILRITKEVYISFNENMGSEVLGFSLFASDDRSPETALVINKTYLILNGDFRQEYLKAAQQDLPVEACLRVFKDNQEEHKSSWSNDLPSEE